MTKNIKNNPNFIPYNPAEIEPKWQKIWEENELYKTPDTKKNKDNYFALTMFPYPSGDLHIGHWYAFTPADAHARYMRMKGYNVMHPQGFDAFGLPAENAAIERNINPKKWTFENINNMRRQFKLMGNSYDWHRELLTCTPEYYKWNQYFFLEMYSNGIAYRKDGPVWWDPIDQTTLANEQVKDGKSERSGAEVIKKMMPQWYLKITDYAEELLEMDELEWPDRIKNMQKNWIGKSNGVEINFDISHLSISEKTITTFTTRIDTIFGVTFLVLAPENKLVDLITTSEQKEAVESYKKLAISTSEIDRTSTERDKTGVFTGSYCKNPLNNEKVPIFIGDYVLSTYGTGAVMSVPGHDQRDYDFAQKYNLPIKIVISPPNWNGENLTEAYTGEGILVNSSSFDGLSSKLAIEKISNLIEKKNFGKKTITYHLRDWLISRQRYWGTPIPIMYDQNGEIHPVSKEDLPVILPDAKEFKPTGQSPLTLDEDFLSINHPKYGKMRRETDTMDTFVDSSWYHLRFASPNPQEKPFNKPKLDSWMPVHQYMGGAEHAVMHLLYARFFNKVLRDLGYFKFNEPYKRLFNQGVLLKDHQKISKRSNPLAPDPLVKEHGADAVRLYLMFLGPWDQGGDWSDESFNGITRWLKRIWNICTRDTSELIQENQKDDIYIKKLSHKTIKKVINDLKIFKFNTAISSLMEMTNLMNKFWDERKISQNAWKESIKIIILLLAPMAPHITEELWEKNGYKFSVHQENLPSWDENLAADEDITIIVQINGKLRDQFVINKNLEDKEIISLALNLEKIKNILESQEIKREIYVKEKLVNFVV